MARRWQSKFTHSSTDLQYNLDLCRPDCDLDLCFNQSQRRPALCGLYLWRIRASIWMVFRLGFLRGSLTSSLCHIFNWNDYFVCPRLYPTHQNDPDNFLRSRMCDEVRNPQVQVPKAMIGTILLNMIAGLLFLIPVVLVLPDMKALIDLASGQPLPVIIMSAVGDSTGSFFLLIPLIALALFCGIACTTVASRCTWAFARDGGIPGMKWWGPVHRYLKVPLNAMMLSMITQISLGCIYFGSETAFNAFLSAGVIFLTVSCAIPIAASLFSGRKDIAKGKFFLGRVGVFCNIVSLCTCTPSSSSIVKSLLYANELM